MKTEQIAMLHAKTKIFNNRVKQARMIIEEALSLNMRPYVAFSGGIDSTVVFNLVKEQKSDIIGIWSDDEWYLPETDEYVERMQQSNNIHHIRTNAYHTEWFSIKGDWDGIPDYAKSLNMEMVFLGLRQDENSYRRIHLRKFGSLFFAVSDDTWHCNPIYNWSRLDVWAYIYLNNLDYNLAYDKLEQIGIPMNRQRIGPLAQRLVLGYGQISILKRGWPDLYNKFAEQYPEVRAYV